MSELEAVMEYLYANRAPRLAPGGLAEVFSRLIWCLEDNGAGIVRIQREWFASDDIERVKIALEMHSVFPFESNKDMDIALASILKKWPELGGKCAEFATGWQSYCRSS